MSLYDVNNCWLQYNSVISTRVLSHSLDILGLLVFKVEWAAKELITGRKRSCIRASAVGTCIYDDACLPFAVGL